MKTTIIISIILLPLLVVIYYASFWYMQVLEQNRSNRKSLDDLAKEMEADHNRGATFTPLPK